jgi:hypothetical protein
MPKRFHFSFSMRSVHRNARQIRFVRYKPTALLLFRPQATRLLQWSQLSNRKYCFSWFIDKTRLMIKDKTGSAFHMFDENLLRQIIKQVQEGVSLLNCTAHDTRKCYRTHDIGLVGLCWRYCDIKGEGRIDMTLHIQKYLPAFFFINTRHIDKVFK